MHDGLLLHGRERSRRIDAQPLHPRGIEQSVLSRIPIEKVENWPEEPIDDQQAKRTGGIAQVASGTERCGTGRTGSTRSVDVQASEVALDFIGQRAHRLRELVAKDDVVRGAVVVETALFFAVPAHRSRHPRAAAAIHPVPLSRMFSRNQPRCVLHGSHPPGGRSAGWLDCHRTPQTRTARLTRKDGAVGIPFFAFTLPCYRKAPRL